MTQVIFTNKYRVISTWNLSCFLKYKLKLLRFCQSIFSAIYFFQQANSLFLLLFLKLLSAETYTTFGASSSNHSATTWSAHACAKAVGTFTFDITWLKCAFHLLCRPLKSIKTKKLLGQAVKESRAGYLFTPLGVNVVSMIAPLNVVAGLNFGTGIESHHSNQYQPHIIWRNQWRHRFGKSALITSKANSPHSNSIHG